MSTSLLRVMAGLSSSDSGCLQARFQRIREQLQLSKDSPLARAVQPGVKTAMGKELWKIKPTHRSAKKPQQRMALTAVQALAANSGLLLEDDNDSPDHYNEQQMDAMLGSDDDADALPAIPQPQPSQDWGPDNSPGGDTQDTAAVPVPDPGTVASGSHVSTPSAMMAHMRAQQQAAPQHDPFVADLPGDSSAAAHAPLPAASHRGGGADGVGGGGGDNAAGGGDSVRAPARVKIPREQVLRLHNHV